MTSVLSSQIRISHHATDRFLERVASPGTSVRDAHRIMVAMLCRALSEPDQWTLPRHLWDMYAIREKEGGQFGYWLLLYNHPNRVSKTRCVFITQLDDGVHVVTTVRTLKEQK